MLLEQVLGESDPAKRRALHDQLWRQVQADLPLIYLWTTRNILGVIAQSAGGRAARKRVAAVAGHPAGSVGAAHSLTSPCAKACHVRRDDCFGRHFAHIRCVA